MHICVFSGLARKNKLTSNTASPRLSRFEGGGKPGRQCAVQPTLVALHTLHHVNVIAMRATLALRDRIRALNRHCRDTAQQKHIVLAQNPASSPDDATSANAALCRAPHNAPTLGQAKVETNVIKPPAAPKCPRGASVNTTKITPHSRAPKISRPNAQQAPARRPLIRHFLCFDTTRNTNGAIMPSAIAPPHIAATPVYPKNGTEAKALDEIHPPKLAKPTMGKEKRQRKIITTSITSPHRYPLRGHTFNNRMRVLALRSQSPSTGQY